MRYIGPLLVVGVYIEMYLVFTGVAWWVHRKVRTDIWRLNGSVLYGWIGLTTALVPALLTACAIVLPIAEGTWQKLALAGFIGLGALVGAAIAGSYVRARASAGN